MTKLSSKVLASALIAGTAFAFSGMAPAPATAKELKIATFMGPKHFLNRVIFTKLAKDIGAATNGRVTSKLFASGQLGKGPRQQYKRVLDNVSEITFGITGQTSTIFPKSMIVTQPGVGTTAVEITGKMWGIYDQYLKSEYAKFRMLGIWSNTPGSLIMTKSLVTKISDLKGLKLRALDPTNIPQVRSWGASGISLPISGVYDALDKGVVDGVYVAINALFAPWRFSETSKFVTDGFNAQSAIFWLAMNSKVWDGLSSADQKAIDGLTGKDFSMKTAAGWAEPDVKALARAKKGDVGIKYHRLSDAERAKFDLATAKAVEAMLAKNEKNGIPAREIYRKLTSGS